MTLGDLRPKQLLEGPPMCSIQYLAIIIFKFIASLKLTFLTSEGH